MGHHKWELRHELKDLCVKCTTLKPPTAKKYAKKFFDKFDEDCITDISQTRVNELHQSINDLEKALTVLKSGNIESINSVLRIKDVSYIEFKDSGVIEVTTKNDKLIRYTEGFSFLKYVFNS